VRLEVNGEMGWNTSYPGKNNTIKGITEGVEKGYYDEKHKVKEYRDIHTLREYD